MQEWDGATFHEVEAVGEHRVRLGREAGDQVGADGDPRPQGAGPGDHRQHVGAQMPPLHALQDEIAAGLDRQMQMRHQPRLVLDQPPQIVVDRRRIERGQPQPRQLRHQRQQPPHHLAE